MENKKQKWIVTILALLTMCGIGIVDANNRNINSVGEYIKFLYVSEELTTKDLAVTGDTIMANTLRVDGSTHLTEVYVDETEGWTGTCDGGSLEVVNGIVVGCGYS
jgi:hypothetical protein